MGIERRAGEGLWQVSECEGLRTRNFDDCEEEKTDVPVQKERSIIPTHTGEGDFQTTDSNINLFQKHPHRYTHKYFTTSMGIS